MKYENLYYFILASMFSSASLHAAKIEQSASVAEATPNQTLVAGENFLRGKELVVEVETNDYPTDWIHLFVNADGKKDTGFIHYAGGNAGQGLDLLVEGNTVYRFDSADNTQWGWTPIPDVFVEKETDDHTVTWHIPVKELGLTDSASLLVVAYTDDYVSARDTLPRDGSSWKITKAGDSAQLESEQPMKLDMPDFDRREAFKHIESYACYYVGGMEKELSSRDAVIIETRTQSPESIERIRRSGTLVIGYISIGEDSEMRRGDGKGPGGYDSRYYDRDRDNMPDKNGIWSSYYADAKQPSWRRYFLDKAFEMREKYHLDGFFLDTVDTSDLYHESAPAMISLIRELRAQNPDSIIVINRGFHTIEPLGADIDGVMFESFTASWDWGTKDYNLMRPSAWDYGLELWQSVLKPAMDKDGIVILALDYAGSPDAPEVKIAIDRAKTFGFIPELTTIYLDKIYDVDYKGQTDPKYLEIQTTPEKLAFQLQDDRNGFPEGTTVTPSSVYPDYEVSPVVDGVSNKEELNWRHRAWASWEKSSEHSLEFRMPSPVRVSGMRVDWAWDNGQPFASRNFRLEILPAGASEDGWKEVAEVQDNDVVQNALTFDPSDVVAIRLVQEPGGGSEYRPNLMWVEQIKLLQ